MPDYRPTLSDLYALGQPADDLARTIEAVGAGIVKAVGQIPAFVVS